jgi:DNA-binding CsgD family transcriptional regulator
MRFDLDPRPVTTKEMEVWRELCNGLNLKAIAVKFNRSVKTINTHMFWLYRKLDKHSVQEVIVEGYKRGILKYPSASIANEIIGLRLEMETINLRIEALLKEYVKDTE